MYNGNAFPPEKEVNNDKYGYLRSLDTAKLQALLQQESFLGPDDKLDVDLIKEIVASLDEREPLGEELDTELSLKALREEIIPQLEKEKIEASLAPSPSALRPGRIRRRMATILTAAVVSILLGGTLVASAFEYNIWQYFISWGKDTLQISSEVHDTSGPSDSSSPEGSISVVKPEQYQSLDEAVEALNTEFSVPKWIPDGLELVSAMVHKSIQSESLTALYKAGDSTIIFSASIYFEGGAAYSFEKDETGGETVTIAGNTCYIITNVDQTGIIWIDKDVVYSIHSNTGRDNLIKMVESIYEE